MIVTEFGSHKPARLNPAGIGFDQLQKSSRCHSLPTNGLKLNVVILAEITRKEGRKRDGKHMLSD